MMAAEESLTVLIAVDGSEEAREAFEFYLCQLHKPEDEILLLYCPEMTNVTYRLMKQDDVPYDEWLKIWDEERAKWNIVKEKYMSELNERQLKGKFEVEPSSHAGDEIVKFAHQKKVNYIVTGTRGQGVIRRTIMGSVSDYVLHHAHVPVIIYKTAENP